MIGLPSLSLVLFLSGPLEVGVGAFKFGETTIGEIAVACGASSSAIHEVRDGVVETMRVVFVSAIPGGCVEWESGPLGEWSALTSVTILSENALACRSATRCRVAEDVLTAALRECGAATLWKYGIDRAQIDAGVTRLQASNVKTIALSDRMVYEYSGYEVVLARGGRCKSLRRFLMFEQEIFSPVAGADAGVRRRTRSDELQPRGMKLREE